MSKKLFKFFLLSSLIVLVLANPMAGLAQGENLEGNLEAFGRGADYNTQVNEQTVPQIIGNVIAIILGFIGTIFFILIIYSGFQWMTAGGNEEKVKESRDRIKNAVIGLVVTVAAYAITYLVTSLFE